ncbi:MAG: aminoacyl-histidine dipeptidase [Veillonellaceae bacterium]|nr:aminoacyl-histidine dipeptidase [Veillonellaceae bacterium]
MKPSIQPQAVFDKFYDIDQIPRGSGNEKAISDYLVAFAKDHGYEAKQDSENNVIIKVPATKGYESAPSVILQGHMDMVCEKTPESTHDFTKDPIEFVVDGDWLKAKDTTLGADDGMAVAMMLAIMDDPSIPHGPMECLITTNEETGMNGAIAVKGSDLSGKYLLNLDSEDEGEFTIGCAGGCHVEIGIPLLRENRNHTYNKAFHISVEGLLGGHSGMEIVKQRANANQILARTLYEMHKSYSFQTASFSGGTKHNAIPRQAETVIAVKEVDFDAIKNLLAHLSQVYQQEFTPQDAGLTLSVKEVEAPDLVYADDTVEALVAYLILAPNGVYSMSQTLPGNIVETSNNLAIVQEKQNFISILISTRSSSKSSLDFLVTKLTGLAEVLGISSRVSDGYPAWEYQPGSDLEKQVLAIYKKVTGKEPILNSVHAGLECGLLKEQLPDTQMISFGPTVQHPHTPQERVSISSVDRMYTFLLTVLKELK